MNVAAHTSPADDRKSGPDESARWHLAGGTIEMHVQPIVDLSTNTTVIFESLARLAIHDQPLLAAGEFVPELNSQQVDHLFTIALDQSLKALSEWIASGHTFDVSINIDPITLLNPHCADWIDKALLTHGIAPERLLLELLETRPIRDPRQSSTLAAIRERGVRLAIDDLGAGHSDIERLNRFDFDVVKIDGSIIAELSLSPEATLTLLSQLIRIAEAAGRTVVVEGIETPEMVTVASIIGGRLGQGYAIAKPMPIADVPEWITAQTSAPWTKHVSFATILAFHWNHRGAQHPGDVGDCSIASFLAQHADDEPVDLWHAAQHGTENADRAASSRLLTNWLIGRMGKKGLAEIDDLPQEREALPVRSDSSTGEVVG